ncbi:Hypothetical_protein [Hexamita inflata]|uniref:Hypothetical_protein n=1 Tax=Hexamita inflata TaxID=28002 RepID=A0AA86Q479_9EUKA|nr:Hypothetical protein HINF_LOCUS32949 [Hexamita inflata]
MDEEVKLQLKLENHSRLGDTAHRRYPKNCIDYGTQEACCNKRKWQVDEMVISYIKPNLQHQQSKFFTVDNNQFPYCIEQILRQKFASYDILQKHLQATHNQSEDTYGYDGNISNIPESLVALAAEVRLTYIGVSKTNDHSRELTVPVQKTELVQTKVK